MLACKMKPLPFNLCNPKKRPAIINRSYALLHTIAATSLIFYRVSSLLHSRPSLPHLLVFASELILSLLWLLNQAYLWTPVSRKTFPERLLQEKGEELPGIDVFICTADPKKEPPLEVMNTVLSAMALDYPIGKLSVYVSDDGGSSSTLHAIREAGKFGRSWLPFCTRFGIKTRCPKAYFPRYEDDLGEKGYHEEKEKIKQQYKWLEEHVKKAGSSGGMLGETCSLNSINHPAHIEVIQDESHDTNQAKMPLLVYVSREKSPSSPHHFKAGALNVLLRVSSMISNSPYILLLDCNMRCNDPTSALQAMCFHLDPRISSNLAFVQFPQKFHNLSTMDIYDGKLRSVFLVSDPYFSIFLFIFLSALSKNLYEILATGGQIRTWTNERRIWMIKSVTSDFYGCVDAILSKLGMSQASFLPTSKVTDDEQVKRYEMGVFDFQAPTMLLAPLATIILVNIASLVGGVVRMVAMDNGDWKKMVSDPYFSIFLFIFISALSKNLYEVFATGGQIRTWTNERRIWMIKSVTSDFYGCVDAILSKLGMSEASFLPTSKVTDDEQVKRYEMGVFDFQAPTMLLAPLATIILVNIASLVGGVVRMVAMDNGDWKM
ncbi:Cellulose synthase - like 10, partial [Theobroma cacao]